MLQTRLKTDLKRLTNSPVVGNLSKQFSAYEEKVRRFVRDFDLKSREARDTGRRRLDEFTTQLRHRRGEVEKKMTRLLNEEGKRLNQRVGELVNYLKSLAKNEKLKVKGKSTAPKRKASKAKSDSAKPKRSRKSTVDAVAAANGESVGA